MNDLAAWLLECVTQDEAVAREQRKFEQYVEGTGRMFAGSHAIVSMAPHRAVAECEAKIRVLAVHNIWDRVYPHNADNDGDMRCVGCGFDGVEEVVTSHVDNCPVLRALALPYADWPGYRAEWKP
jgi:hypothetical protein